ncbi:hypothetical protein TFLX_05738 [Thermoflexales bacterium]|nr:hypothetical protein TFLX_05738 [Thermoflexales bacterium]
MTRKWLYVAFLVTLALTVIGAQHQLTNAATNGAPPPQHAPSLAPASSSAWEVISGSGTKEGQFADISLGAANDGWAVGTTGPSSFGLLMHYNGSDWSQATPPTETYSLNAVKMISPQEGWAVGDSTCQQPVTACDGSVLLHHMNGDWQRSPLPAYPGGGYWNRAFYDVDIKGSIGWIVGISGKFLKYDGLGWSVVNTPYSAHKVTIVNADEAWAIGPGTLLHYSGGGWSPVSVDFGVPPTYTVSLRSIHMLNATEGWVAGYAEYSNSYSSFNQCLLLHYTGGVWVRVACPSDDVRLKAIKMRSATDGWAIGNRVRSYDDVVILHYDGVNWTTVPVPVGISGLNSIELVGTNDGWLVGNRGTVLRLTDGNWTRVQGTHQDTWPLDAVSSSEVWRVGANQQIEQWKDGIVTTYTSPLTMPITALDMVSPTLGWFGTWSPPAYYLARYSAGTWTTWPMTSGVQTLTMLGPDEGWVGTFRNILHYQAGTFESQYATGSMGGVTSISMIDSNYGWAIDESRILTYTHGIWSPFAPTLTAPIGARIIGVSSEEAWVTGYYYWWGTSNYPVTAELHHFTNGAWTKIPTPAWIAFFDISKVSATEWWAVGKLQTLAYAFLHYKDGVYTTVPAGGEDARWLSMLPDGIGFASGMDSLLRLHLYPYGIYLPMALR